MNLLKKHLEVGQLDLHFKNLTNQLNKTILENNQINIKMYNLNFQKLVLKFHKLIVDFMNHLTIKEDLYHYFDKIKTISQTLHQASKDRKARSSRTYDDETLSKFSKFTSSTHFLGSGISESQIDDKKQVDQIQQFMMSRNFLHPIIFGQMDEGYKSKSRNQLQQFLSTADIHAKNLQYQLKSSSNQRKKMSNSFKIGGLSKSKMLLKKTTFDLQRINQLTKGDHSNELQSENNILQITQKQDRQVQTILNEQNIQWNKILTYCLKDQKLKQYLSLKDSSKQQNGDQRESQFNQQFQKEFMELFDPQIFGQFKQIHLINSQTQTKRQNENNKSTSATPRPLLKPSSTNLNQKKPKAAISKSSNIQKRNKTKQKESKINSTHTKINQVQSPKEDILFMQKQNILTFQKSTECVIQLSIDYGTVNEYFIPQSQYQQTHTTFQGLTSPKSKKSMKALQLKQLIFEYTSKKQLQKKAQLLRNQVKKKSLNNSYQERYYTQNNHDSNNNRFTMTELSNNKKIKNQELQEQRSYETTINIEQGLVRRRLSKKNTWKGSTNSSNSILKSVSKLHQLKTDHNICIQSESMRIGNSKGQNNTDDNQNNCDISQQKRTSKHKNHLSNGKHRRISHFKQMYGSTNKSEQKKGTSNKRNTLDNLIIDDSLNKQFQKHNQFGQDKLLKNKILEEQYQTSYKNTQQKIKTNVNICIQQKKEAPSQNKSKIVQKNEDSSKRHTSPTKKLEVKIKPEIRIHHTQPRNQNKHIFKGKTVRIKTTQKQNKSEIISKPNQIQRNNRTLYDIQNTPNFIGRKRKKHFKYASQDLPQLSNCKQKLSDIKNSMKSQMNNTNKVQLQGFNRLLKRQKKVFNDQNVQKIYSNSIIPTNKYKRILPNSQTLKKTLCKSLEEDEKIMNTIRKLFMTKSYRDKLLLYLSMIQVTHEKYCGKNCQHVTKFIDNLTGQPIDCSQSVADQLLRLYNNGKVHNFKLNKA